MKAIEVLELINRFGAHTVHDKISFDVNSGEVFGILGSSGSGKSTLFKTLTMLMKPTSGTIKILGQNISKINHKQRREILNQCGILFQFGALFSFLNTIENVGIMLEEYSNLPKKTIHDIAKMWLTRTGIKKEAFYLYPHELSGGMRKRVSLARAMVLSPKILFLDEPTSGLDPLSSSKFDDLILELKSAYNFTAMIITHDLETIKRITDRFLILKDGQIDFIGNIEKYNSIYRLELDTRGR